MRLLSKRGEFRDQRIFLVGELVSGFESVSALIVAPASASASYEELIAVLGDCRVDDKQLEILAGDDELTLAGRRGASLAIRRLRVGEQRVYILDVSEAGARSSTPRELGLSRGEYGRLCRVCARLAGARLLDGSVDGGLAALRCGAVV